MPLTRPSRKVAFRSAKGCPFAERKATMLRRQTSPHLAEMFRGKKLLDSPKRFPMAHSFSIGARETAILTRAIQPNNHNLSATAARAILRIQLDPNDRPRLHELLIKNQEDVLTADERSELDSHLHVDMLLDLLLAKARAALRTGNRR